MEKDYEEIIDEQIKRATDKYSDFFNLVKCAKGIHPLEIVNSLKRLKCMNLLSEEKYFEIDKSKCAEAEKYNIYAKPVAHFLDSDWRFSEKGVQVLVQNVKKYIKKGQTIIFLGVPTLFKYFVNEYPQFYNYVFLDRNANKHIGSMELSENVIVVDSDVSKLKDYNVQADIVIMDPPWYLECYKLFMNIAYLISNPNAIVLSVMPPITTRPTVKDEYEKLEEYLKELGICIIEYKSNVIEYQMPPFERNTLRINGIVNIPDNWRTGDLLIAIKKLQIADQRLLIHQINNDKMWWEFDCGTVRIKYCIPNELKITSGFIELRSIYEGDIYPSVSRRFKGNTAINVWTSGNRVYICNNLPLLHFIFQNWNDRDAIDVRLVEECDFKLKVEERESIKEYMNKLINIIVNEEREYGDEEFE